MARFSDDLLEQAVQVGISEASLAAYMDEAVVLVAEAGGPVKPTVFSKAAGYDHYHELPEEVWQNIPELDTPEWDAWFSSLPELCTPELCADYEHRVTVGMLLWIFCWGQGLLLHDGDGLYRPRGEENAWKEGAGWLAAAVTNGWRSGYVRLSTKQKNPVVEGLSPPCVIVPDMTLEELAQNLIHKAETLEKEARSMRSLASLVRHPHTKASVLAELRTRLPSER